MNKTIKELYDEGYISTRTYNTIRRGLDSMLCGKLEWSDARRVCDALVNSLTVRALFDMFGGEERIKMWRGMGDAGIKQLKRGWY
jgi:hypothetical protein